MDRPIIFSAPMIRALREGRKTQTRRILKPQPQDNGIYADIREAKRALRWVSGDRLWVRESMRRDRMVNFLTGERSTNADAAYYSADDCECLDPSGFNYAWTWARPNLPSIHMPRWASRLTLIVESVNVERLQDMNRGDAMDEGCPFPNMANGENPLHWFRDLWESINGPRSWDANPWVAAITFRVVKANVDALCEEVAP